MPQTQPMEIVLETADYQNFWVRSVPLATTPSPIIALPGCRILLIAPNATGVSNAPSVADNEQIPAGPKAATA